MPPFPPTAASAATTAAVFSAQPWLSALTLLALHLPVIFFSAQAARLLQPGQDLLPRLLAAFLLYFFSLSTALWLLPQFSLPWLFAAALALGGVGLVLRLRLPPAEPSASPPLPFSARMGILSLALLSLALLFTALLHPRFEHDSLTYQLHFPAVWLHTGKISIVPTPFGDPSQAYAPALTSAFYLWLMAPLGTDLLASAGGLPFFLLALLSAAGLARQWGARPGSAWTAAAFLFLVPIAGWEGRTALSDLSGAAFFAAGLYFFLRAASERRRADFFLALLASGLMLGTKYTALLISLLLLPAAAAAALQLGVQRALVPALAGLAAALPGGGLWYLRNFLHTGSPVFPFRITLAGKILLPGLYGQEEMQGWAFDYAGLRAWREIMEVNFSPLFLLVAGAAGAFILFESAQKIRQRLTPRPASGAGRTGSTGEDGSLPPSLSPFLSIYLVLLPFLLDRMIWHLFPYQVYRFWLPSAPLLAALAATVYSRRALLMGIALLLSWAGCLLPSSHSELTGNIRLFLAAGFPISLLLGAGLATTIKKDWPQRLRFRPGALLFAWAAAGLSGLVFTAVLLSGWESRWFEGLRGMSYEGGWRHLLSSSARVIAYTGANVPYPLHGPHLNKRVIYVSPSGRVQPLDHELMRAAKDSLPDFATPEPMMASLALCPRAWVVALMEAGADVLFVMRLPRNALLNSPHDAGGWPWEDQWARQLPSLFKLEYEDRFNRIYLLQRAADSELHRLPADCELRPADPLRGLRESPEEAARFFPRAWAAAQEMKLGEPKRRLK